MTERSEQNGAIPDSGSSACYPAITDDWLESLGLNEPVKFSEHTGRWVSSMVAFDHESATFESSMGYDQTIPISTQQDVLDLCRILKIELPVIQAG